MLVAATWLLLNLLVVVIIWQPWLDSGLDHLKVSLFERFGDICFGIYLLHPLVDLARLKLSHIKKWETHLRLEVLRRSECLLSWLLLERLQTELFFFIHLGFVSGEIKCLVSSTKGSCVAAIWPPFLLVSLQLLSIALEKELFSLLYTRCFGQEVR